MNGYNSVIELVQQLKRSILIFVMVMILSNTTCWIYWYLLVLHWKLHINQFILDTLQEPKYVNVQHLILTTFGRPGDLDKALLIFPNLVKILVLFAWIPDSTNTLVEYAKARKGLMKVRNRVYFLTNGVNWYVQVISDLIFYRKSSFSIQYQLA